LDVIAPMPLAVPAAIQIDHNLMGAELQPGDLNFIARANGCAVRRDGAIQHFGLQRLPNVQAETLFARRQGLDGLGKFTGYVTNEIEFGSLLEGGVLRGARSARRRLALRLSAIRGCAGVWEKRNLLVGRKAGDRLRRRAKAVDSRDVRVSQEQKRQR
jgi:hypothetical protein